MVINKENLTDEIKKELKCINEIKRKWRVISKNKNNTNLVGWN